MTNMMSIITDACLYQPTEFTIDSRAVPKVKGEPERIFCGINNPSGGVTEKVITPHADGTYKVNYTPFEEGKHNIEVLYDSIPVPGSPFNVDVKKVSDAKKCRAFGPGLQRAVVDKPNQFTVETRGNLFFGLKID